MLTCSSPIILLLIFCSASAFSFFSYASSSSVFSNSFPKLLKKSLNPFELFFGDNVPIFLSSSDKTWWPFSSSSTLAKAFFINYYLLLIVCWCRYSLFGFHFTIWTSTLPLFMKYIPNASSAYLKIVSDGKNRSVERWLTINPISISEQSCRIGTFLITPLWSLNRILFFRLGDSSLKNLFRSWKTSGVSLMYYK